MSAIYITNLPLDVTIDEVYDHFGQIGIIQDDKKNRGRARIKIYTNEDGSLKGDGIVYYADDTSAAAAIEWFNNTDFRDGYVIGVQLAGRKDNNNEPPTNNNGFFNIIL